MELGFMEQAAAAEKTLVTREVTLPQDKLEEQI
jgi:hypothetical protein